MIEIAKGKGGFPWHGLYRAATGKITPPVGPQIDAPWAPYFINTGHCYMVKIPGLPVPTTSPEEESKGMSWVNYALLCGESQALYGVNLGSDASIYLDSHNKPWLMRVVVGGSRASATIGATVSLRRFGKIGPVEAPINYSMVTATFATSPNNTHPGGSWAEQLDISRDGRQQLIGISRYADDIPGNWLGYACIAQLSVTGSPDDGDVAISIQVIADETAENWDMTTVWEGGGGVWVYRADLNTISVSYGSRDFNLPLLGELPWAGSRSNSRAVLGGARFSAAGTPEVLMVRSKYQRELFLDSETLAARSYTQVGRDIESVTMSLEVAGVVIGQSGLTRTTAFTQTLGLDGASCSAVETTDEGGTIYTKSYSDANGFRDRSGFFGFEVAAPNDLERYGICLRLSNSVYSLRSWGYSETTGSGMISPDRYIFGPAVGVIGSDPSTMALPASPASAHPVYATEHPVTGAVVRSTSPVCWV